MLDLVELKKKQENLNRISKELKEELFGIDDIIDRVINLMRVWYLMPSLLSRPVIINLWGMTGTGKTSLVRRIAQKLEFNNKFVEIQMDGVSGGTSYSSSINSILSESSISEGEPGIVLLDEMQRFRTINAMGEDIKIERYQDVWMLLSDGKFALNSGFFDHMEMMIAMREYDEEHPDDEDDSIEAAEAPVSKKNKIPSKYKIYPYEAAQLKKTLKRRESIQEIMTWSTEHVLHVINEFKRKFQSIEIDYTKMLIFVSGNLDELFSGADSVDDSDTDADIYYERTKKLTPANVKTALKERFKPEQISRFGSNNIVYPSLSKSTYMKIIKHTCQKYIDEIKNLSGLTFTLSEKLYQEIYDNAVYPTQGTRPVFSAIHQILGSALSEFALWALENNHETINIHADLNKQTLIGEANGDSKEIQTIFELRSVRKRASIDFNTMVAVHEAGHALTYALLFGVAPKEIKINLASYSGGYTLDQEAEHYTKKQLLDSICVSLAGSVAEGIVFGEENRTTGNISDNSSATTIASQFVRQYGFGDFVSYIHPENGGADVQYYTNVGNSDEDVETIISAERTRAKRLIKDNNDIFAKIVSELLKNSVITKEDFIKLIDKKLKITDEEDIIPNYVEMWESFNKK